MALAAALEFQGLLQFMISSACYEHQHIIGVTPERMTECETGILDICKEFAAAIYAWCVLPNHYHLMVQTDRLKKLRAELGGFRTSFKWNGEDDRRGRQVWHNCLDRGVKSHRHFWA
jgi:putative transposase